MAHEQKRIPFAEFSANLNRIFAQVIHDQEAVLVESENGELLEVKPVPPVKSRRRVKTQEDYEAFLSSLGGWKDVDVDSFLKDNEESRRISTRPPVDL